MKQEMHVLGIDIAERVFHAVGMDDRGTMVYRKRLSVVYLRPADKYPRFTRRLSQEQKGLDERASWPPSGPLTPGDALEASRVDARRLLRSPPLAASHPHGVLTPPRAGATAAPERAAPRAGSRHGRSVQRPWRASAAASAWPSPCRVSAQAGAGVGVHWREVSRNYSTRDTRPAAGVCRLHPCRAW
jgi:hypothetical protein